MKAPWTEEELETLKELAEKGVQMEDIFKVFSNRTPEAVKNRLSRLNVARPLTAQQHFDRELAMKLLQKAEEV